MIKGPHHDPGWVLWPGNASVEYQVEREFLRIRRWENGQPIISEWRRCDGPAETGIRHQLSLMRQRELLANLPPLPEKAKDGDKTDHALLEWFFNTIMHPLGPLH